MKSKDQQLLEEAYTKINESDMTAPTASGIDPETAQMYYNALEKYSNGELTSQQWYDICAKLLGDLMEQHKDVFVRLKNR